MHAMQIENIDNYLVDDTVFNEMNRRFVSLNPDDVKEKNRHLKKVFKELIEIMRLKSPLFDKTYKSPVWAGSFFKKTKVGSPEEYDLNLVINLPIRERDLKFSTNQPGYIKICLVTNKENLHHTLDKNSKEYREMMSFIDEQSYLNQENFRRWIESILSTAAFDTNNTNNQIKLRDYTITIKKSGPAFTLSLFFDGSTISIDMVPVLTFSKTSLPPYCRNRNMLHQFYKIDRFWFAVPKLLKNRGTLNKQSQEMGDLYRYWRLCFYEFEKDMLSRHGRAKPIIRHLKKFRDTERWKSVASYYIETLCFHHLDMFEDSKRESYTYLFFMMLQKLHEAFHNHCLKYYWDSNLNLLEHIQPAEMKNIERRLFHIIRDINKQIINDQYVIAKYVLNKEELNDLIAILALKSEKKTKIRTEIPPLPELKRKNTLKK